MDIQKIDLLWCRMKKDPLVVFDIIGTLQSSLFRIGAFVSFNDVAQILKSTGSGCS